jgi:hypothetical protein
MTAILHDFDAENSLILLGSPLSQLFGDYVPYLLVLDVYGDP